MSSASALATARPGQAVGLHPTLKRRSGEVFACDDELTVEEPLEIHVDAMPYAVTMRTPGDDLALVAGFCLGEGLARHAGDLLRLEHCPAGHDRVLVDLHPQARTRAPGSRARRDFVARSSCGLCGKQKMDDIHADLPPVPPGGSLPMDALLRLEADFRTRRPVFARTGSTHQAAVYDRHGACLAAAEDVGRHNALDKAAGRVLLDGTRERAFAVLVSSRLSFEMVLKAVALGARVLAGVSAATTLAVDFAQARNLTLVGFLRPGGMNVYTHRERVAP
ncbi:formate dehydrogenase accessory sulfurtransferase FdhD [Desulfocurvus vexinensis]|uniref:formate dehydrogenase accessory sulfurtransferase FdhD n=1 Tax=Desulfocurvus vexinensis TaxID=399548 RepID=UPI0004B95781|nr:formate dehydrogenase accessory sulfurtransferase FdhD [Desulfocurvus vexinensis]